MKRRVLSLILVPFLLFYALPAGAVEKEERKWQDETIYFLMTDRFHNGDPSNDFEVNVKDPEAYQGGDFQGIIEKLDYLKEMGFTAIELTPIFDNEAKGYHGFWIQDFYKTEEHFGTIKEFKKLVEEAHKRDMKVILDFVVNHVGPNHPWINDPKKEGWFQGKQPLNDNGEENPDLPILNTENPEVKEYLFDAAKWWIKKTDVDGYRLDMVQQASQPFWSEFSKEVKSVKKDFYLLGEGSNNNLQNISKYDDNGIGGFVDFPQAEEMRKVFQKPDVSMEGLFHYFDQNQSLFEQPHLMGTIIDNHDMNRFTSLIVQNKQFPGTRWKLALTYMYTVPGIPIVYYGSEIALNGGESSDNHRLMNFKTDEELIDHITKLGELRQDLPALTRGTMELLYEKDGMAVFKRNYKDETIVVAINNSSKSQQVTISSDELEENKELRGVLAGGMVKEENGDYSIILDRESSEIFALAEKSGLNLSFIGALSAVYIIFLIFIYFVWKRGRKKRKDTK
ncbi:glycosidase [Bacillus pakistanensis]|uniref:alpha-amylase n=1 Tax=Rossellomorea pakistanensis TaxID=992288 RepID=A0ABS2NFE6_9BACI|nr:alpha-amylase family glycosyl hydrolase [Bacillus pakistanensis]MBM7586489.1 glycosidase [Bacillus pakistanensis]